MFIDHLFLILAFYCFSAWGYIPALPANDTAKAVREGGLPVNQSDVSTLSLKGFYIADFSPSVSYQLAGSGSTGLSKGPLLHFSEDNFNNDSAPTETPWIAFISCDRNATSASMEIDIFTLARDKGAKAAVLYSLTSKACIINPEYADPNNFDQVFDIFSTKSLTDSLTIEYQFDQPGTKNTTFYSEYDSKFLNDSVQVVAESIATNTARGPGFIFATLRAYNATGDDTATLQPYPPIPGQEDRRSKSTNSAMIVLYSITGCVSALFVAVIVTGAVRAIRHPERYGARGANAGQGGIMPATRGLARAVLDTFPIFKFSSTTPTTDPAAPKDIETGSNDPSFRNVRAKSMDIEMADWVAVDAKLQAEHSDSERSSKRDSHRQEDSDAPSGEAGPNTLARRNTARTPKPATEEVTPDAIGRETCPICIVDFEEGDDLRMLPCEGKHIFHQRCVDPWLLELSSSCPLCRHDFMALENMLAGEPRPDENVGWRPQSSTANESRQSGASRFSRYLRIARHRRNRQQDSERGSSVEPSGSPEPV